jgi:cytochrome c oxidase assembly factor CtaG
MREVSLAAVLCAALVVCALVALPPLASLAQHLFAAHMLQHLLLIVVAAPLFAVSRPLGRLHARFAEWLTRPAVAWLLFTATFLFWHWPAAFRWAAQAELTRMLELATILFSACVFWSVALAGDDRRRLSCGAAALFVTTAAVVTDLPGVVMLFAPTAICTMPQEDAWRWGITPLQDQQIAGLLMWVPANLVFFALATWLLALWLSDNGRDTTRLNIPGII